MLIKNSSFFLAGQKAGFFDIVIGNPPYIESRSDSVTNEQKEKYLTQVSVDFGDFSKFISRGSDLLIYFFTRTISLLSWQGIGTLIVQNGWLNTDYGKNASKFLLNTLEHIKIIDSSFKHFDKYSANINTVIICFKKKAEDKIVSFNIMKMNNSIIVTDQKKIIDIKDNSLLDQKWGFIMNAQDEIYNIFSGIFNNWKINPQLLYTVGQGINEKKDVFIPIDFKKNIIQTENIINAVFKENQYFYKNIKYFLYHFFIRNKEDYAFLKKIGAEEFAKGKSLKRKYPSIIMPRGIGETHFAGILPEKTLSNSYIDIYMLTPDEDKLLNIWLFCNCSLFFLYREISGRKNLGGGLLKAEASDLKIIPLFFPIANKIKINSLIDKIGEPTNLLERLDTEIQQEIDTLVLSYFNLNDKYNLIVTELRRLFEYRIQKAKS